MRRGWRQPTNPPHWLASPIQEGIDAETPLQRDRPPEPSWLPEPLLPEEGEQACVALVFDARREQAKVSDVVPVAIWNVVRERREELGRRVHRDPVARGSSEILWDTLGDRHCDFSGDGCEVEPGETEEFIFDFVIPSEVIKVQVYTHVENITKSTKNIGWNTTTIHDVGGATNGQEWKNIVTDRAGEAETDQGASTALEETVGEINMARDETRQGSPKVVKVTKQGTLKPIKPKVESGGDRRIAKK